MAANPPQASPRLSPSISPSVSPRITTSRLPRVAEDGNGAEALDGGHASTATFVNPPLKRTDTTQSKLSRIVSQLPNPERGIAERPGGPGGPGGPPGLKKYSHKFFSPEMKMFRGIVFKILGMTVVLTIFVMWTCASFYWGSLWKGNHYTDKLTVRVIDLDGGPIGQAISSSLLSRHELGYFHTDANKFPDMAAIEHDIVQEGAWGTITINKGASAGLEAARATGDSSYDGRKAVSFIFAQARNELATGSYLLPLGQAALSEITGKLSAQSTAQYMASNAGNSTAMNLVARAPTTIASPIGFSIVNLRPYDQPVATAITLVGNIYVLIFAFMSTMANNGAREIIAPYLTTRSYLLYRVCAPLLLYLPLSFAFAMVNLPFKPHFDAHFTYAGGFFLWWFILYLGMGALGLSTEFVITILGPKFTGFFLVPLIVANVSGVSVPHELQPWIYRYAVAMPFYNLSRAVRTLIFNTKNTLGLNIGILLAWMAVSLITIPLTTWLYRRGAVNEHRREVGENETEIKTPDGRIV